MIYFSTFNFHDYIITVDAYHLDRCVFVNQFVHRFGFHHNPVNTGLPEWPKARVQLPLVTRHDPQITAGHQLGIDVGFQSYPVEGFGTQQPDEGGYEYEQ